MNLQTSNSREQLHSYLTVTSDKPSVCGTLFFMEHWKNLSPENIVEEFEGVTYVEEWKPVVGYEGLYEISSFGRVKSCKRNFRGRGGKMYNRKGIVRKQFDDCKRGYLKIILHKDGTPTSFSVHRLVAMAFIGNKENLPEVNHVLGLKKDNRVHRLIWSTSSDNQQHAYDVLHRVKPMLGKFGKNHHTSKPINQYSLEGKFIKRWDSIIEVERGGISFASNVGYCLRTGRGSAGGYMWSYAEK